MRLACYKLATWTWLTKHGVLLEEHVGLEIHLFTKALVPGTRYHYSTSCSAWDVKLHLAI